MGRSEVRGLSLFSGLGAFDVALAPWVTPACGCEIDPWTAALYERRIGVPVVPDVREIDAGLGPFEVLSGGFPCQPVSQAGKGLAQEDDRWLWPEFRRLIALFEPECVFIENVPGLRRRGLVGVLRDLHELGYRASWDGIPAAAVGAPHLRDRVWIVAYREERWTSPIFGETVEMFGRPLEDAAGMRAGILDEDGLVHSTEPVAPVRTERRDGWSYWTGVRLGEALEHPLYPTPKAARYGSSQNGLNGVNGEKRRPSAGTPSLDTIAARGLWPTPKSSPSGPDFARAGREQSGGDDLATAVYRNEKGPLNPDWVEWLMGLPCGWTDPEREPIAHPWTEPGALYPTPQAADGDGGRVSATLRGKRPSGAHRAIPLGAAVNGGHPGWENEPLPRERLTALGNALVWQVPRLIARQAFGLEREEMAA
jgi:site-specific DNA-cytosine methylase